MFSLEVCSLEVLHGEQKVNNVKFWTKKCEVYLAENFSLSLVFGHKIPGSGCGFTKKPESRSGFNEY